MLPCAFAGGRWPGGDRETERWSGGVGNAFGTPGKLDEAAGWRRASGESDRELPSPERLWADMSLPQAVQSNNSIPWQYRRIVPTATIVSEPFNTDNSRSKCALDPLVTVGHEPRHDLCQTTFRHEVRARVVAPCLVAWAKASAPVATLRSSTAVSRRPTRRACSGGGKLSRPPR
eukprot:scaffold153350_cov30-Tisochrysis_lutea.AAC.8